MTLTHAVKLARAEVSLVRFGRQWAVHTWDAGRRAWWSDTPGSWAAKRELYRRCIMARALVNLGLSDEAVWCGRDWTLRGSVASCVRFALTGRVRP